jgi:hypothetical protein
MRKILLFLLSLGYFAVLAQPANDTPCTATVINNNDCLSNQTTVGATGYSINGQSAACNAGASNMVFYKINIPSGLNISGVDVAIGNASFTGNITVYLLSLASCNASTVTVQDAFCDILPSDPIHLSSYSLNESGGTYYIGIGSANTGTFDVCFNLVQVTSGCANNNYCGTSGNFSAETVNVVIDHNVEGGVETCVPGCNLEAGPGPALNDCDLSNHAVWYRFNTGAGTNKVTIRVNSFELQTPKVALVSTTNCSAFTVVNCQTGSNGEVAISSQNVPVNTFYYVVVDDVGGDQGNFELCIVPYIQPSSCNTNDNITIKSTSLGSPANGPYLPGENVEICYNIIDWDLSAATNDNWLQGIVPSFGDCWDPSSFNLDGSPAIITTPLVNGSGTWRWFQDGEIFYNYSSPIKGYAEGESVGAGWFYVGSVPANPPCTDPTDPDCTWGDNNENFTICFMLTVKSEAGCLADGSCVMEFTTFADGEIGGWNSTGCQGDGTFAQAFELNCCTAMTAIENETTACSGEPLNIKLFSGVVDDATFFWSVADNTNVTGENSGSGTHIRDTLVNTSATNQVVIYTFTPNLVEPYCQAASANYRVTVTPGARANAGSDIQYCHNGTNTLQLNGSIGGLATSATWSGGSGTFSPNASTLNATYTPSAAELAAGSATLTLTTNDPIGSCTPATDQVTISITNITAATAYSNTGICAGQTLNLQASGGNTYAWSGPVSFSSNLQNPTRPNATTAMSGSYTVTITGANSCSIVRTINVTVNPGPTASASATKVSLCEGETLNLQASGGTSYAWSGPASFSSNLQNPTRPNLTSAMAGSYIVTVTDGNMCSSTATVNITVNAVPTASASATKVSLCEGESLNLQASGGSTYAWSGPASFSSNQQNPTRPNATTAMTGLYNVTVTSGGCSSTATVDITVNALPTANPSSNTPVCAGQTLNLQATGGSTYAWSGPASFSSSQQNPTRPNATTAMSGSYTVTVTDGNMCSDTKTITVAISDAPTVNAGTDVTSCAGSVALIGSIGGSASSATWGGGSGTFSPSVNSLTATYTPSAAEIAAGAVALTLTTNDPDGVGGCDAATDQVTITIIPGPTANADMDISVCANDLPVALNGSIGGSAVTATWSGGSGTFSPSANSLTATYTPSAAEIAAGTVTLTLTTNDPDGAGGCNAATDQVTITMNALPIPTASNSGAACVGGNITLTATGGATYQWSSPNGFTSTSPNPMLTAVTTSMSGPYTVTVTSANNCSATATTNVTVHDLPNATATATDATPCVGAPINLQATGGASYTWSGPNGFSNNTATPSIASATATNTGTYIVTVTDNNTCKDTASVFISVKELPIINLGQDKSICAGSPTTITANTSGGSGSGYNVAWSTNETGSSISVSPASTTTYSATVTDSNQCNANDAVTVSVNALPTATIAGGGSICADSGDQAAIDIALTGKSPWTLTYAINGTAQAPISIAASPYILQTEQAGTYTIVNVRDANTCNNTGSGSATVIVNGAPTVSNIATTCDAAGENYVVTFQINGGNPATYSVTGDAGSISATAPYIFTSASKLNGAGYSFTVGDGNGCGTVLVEDPKVKCNCFSAVGSMSPATVTEVCGSTATAVYDGTGEFLDPNDVRVFVLHTIAGATPGTVIATNAAAPSFDFDANSMSYNATYYISAAVGNNDGTGGIDLNDDCLAFAQGSPIRFRETPTATITSNDATICPMNTSNIMVSLTGNAPWTLVYNDGINDVSIAGINNSPYALQVSPSATATYALVGVSNAFCTGTATGAVTVTVSDAVVENLTETICEGASFTMNGKDYDMAGIYRDTIPEGSVSGCDSIIVLDLTVVFPTTNTLTESIYQGQSYTINNVPYTTTGMFTETIPNGASNGCDSIIVLNLTVNPAPTGQINTNSPICEGETLNLSVTSTNSQGPWGCAYVWSGPYGFASTQQNPTIFNVPGSMLGDYSVTITGCDGYVIVLSTNVTVNALPSALASTTDNSVCVGENIELSGSGGTEYIWSGPNGFSSSDQNPLITNAQLSHTGTYSLTVTDANTCQDTASIYIAVNSLPALDVGSDFEVCPGSTAMLTANASGGSGSGYVYTWSNGLASNSIDVAPSVATAYSATVTDGNQCSATDDINVGIHDLPTVSAPTPTCNGTGTGYTVSFSLTANAVAPFTVTSSNGTFNGSTFTSDEFISGTSYTFTFTDGNGCETMLQGAHACDCISSAGTMATATVTACDDAELSVVAPSNAVLDANDAAQFVLHEGNGTALVNVLAMNTTGVFGLLPTMNANQTYYVSYMVGNDDGSGGVDQGDLCLSISKGTPVRFQRVTASIVEPLSLTCEMESIDLDGSASTGSVALTYNWQTADGSIIGNNNTSIVEVSSVGEYSLIVTDTNTGCSDTTSVTVATNDNLPTDLVVSTVSPACPNGKDGSIVVEQVSGGTSPYTYSLNGNSFQSGSTFKGLSDGTYTVYVMDVNGCSFSKEVVIDPAAPLLLNMTQDTTLRLGDSLQLFVDLQAPYNASNIDSIIWLPSKWLDCANCANPISKPQSSITYQTKVFTTEGCKINGTVQLRLDKTRDAFVPNVFVPGGADNRILMVMGGSTISRVKRFVVFDRWGEQMFLAENFAPNDEAYGWGGKFDGKDAVAGVYVYVAEIEFVDGETEAFYGDFTLVR